jgi:hypothetical protein
MSAQQNFDLAARMARISNATNPYRGRRSSTSWRYVNKSRRGGQGNLDFTNGWTDADDQPLQFAIGSDGKVRFRGVLLNGTMGAVAFTLPVGYRPSQLQRFPCVVNDGRAMMVSVNTAGAVTPEAIITSRSY